MRRVRKSMCRQIIACLLTLAMVLLSADISVYASMAERAGGDSIIDEGIFEMDLDGQEGGRWQLASDGTLTITGPVPEVLYGDVLWEDYKEQIQKVNISEGVTCVPGHIFSDYPSLKSVTIPGSVQTIGSEAFELCTGLTEIVIPDGVTQIDNSAFAGCTGLERIVIPGSVAEIWNEAFAGCTKLKEVTIQNPDSELRIWSEAFAGCTGLENIIIPDNVSMLSGTFKDCAGLKSVELSSGGSRLFENCISLETVKLRDTTERIEEFQFRGCTALKEITVPGQVRDIASNAFAGCSNLSDIRIDPQNEEYVFENGILYNFWGGLAICTNKRGGSTFTVPEDVTEIEADAFSACTDLMAIEVASNHEEFSSKDGVLYSKDKTALVYYPQGKTGKNFTVPNEVKTIMASAFAECSSLKNITFPENVTKIDMGAFSNTKLSGIAIFNASCLIDSFAYDSDGEDHYDEIIYGHPGSTAEELANDTCRTFKPLSELPEDPSGDLKPEDPKPEDPKPEDPKPEDPKPEDPKPEDPKPEDPKPEDPKPEDPKPEDPKPEGPIVGEGDLVKGYWKFTSDGTLTISGPNPEYESGECPWEDYEDRIQKVKIEDGATFIPRSAFSGCSILKSVTIPKSVQDIKDYAFASCPVLTDVTIPEGVKTIGQDAFAECKGLKSITIPSSVEYIGREAFGVCTGLEEVVFPENAKGMRIDGLAFGDCTSLEEIVIPDGISQNGVQSADGLFMGCTSLKKADVAFGGYRMFRNCTSLTDVTLRKGTEFISTYQFAGCTALKELTIPEGVTSISFGAFDDCSNLKSITIPSSIEDLGHPDDNLSYTSPFIRCSALAEIDVSPQNKNYIFEDGILYNQDKTELIFCTNARGDSTFAIPDHVKNVYAGALSGCTGIKTIKIPASLENLQYGYGNKRLDCKNLQSIEVDPVNEGYASEDGILYNKDKTVLLHYPQAKPGSDFTVPDHVKTVGDYAFSGCSNLKSITFPESVTEVKVLVFMNTKLSHIVVHNASCEFFSVQFDNDDHDVIIYGHPESTAKELARRSNKTFKPLSELSGDPDDPKPDNPKPDDPKPDNPKPQNPSVTKPSVTNPTVSAKPKKPGTCKVKSLRSKKKKAILKWGKVKNAYRYEVRYSTKKNANGKKYKTSKTSFTTPKLKMGKTYYFKVRACSKKGQKTAWGNWSKVKKVKIK